MVEWNNMNGCGVIKCKIDVDYLDNGSQTYSKCEQKECKQTSWHSVFSTNCDVCKPLRDQICTRIERMKKSLMYERKNHVNDKMAKGIRCVPTASLATLLSETWKTKIKVEMKVKNDINKSENKNTNENKNEK